MGPYNYEDTLKKFGDAYAPGVGTTDTEKGLKRVYTVLKLDLLRTHNFKAVLLIFRTKLCF